MKKMYLDSEYFNSIYCAFFDLNAGDDLELQEEIYQIKMDVSFLKMFFLCLESCSCITYDEQSMERLRSIITPLTVIWPKTHKLFRSILEAKFIRVKKKYKPLSPFLKKLTQDFHSTKFKLEAKIQQSKRQVEGWCIKLMHSSMQCNPETFSAIISFLGELDNNLDGFSRFRAANIVPLKKGIDILSAKIPFLRESLFTVYLLPDEKEILPFLNFTRVFANSAVILTCLYWAKEDNEEIATEMNIVLFDMLQRFVPYAYDITLLYIGSLISYNLLPSDSFLLRLTVESFVDLFFEHLAIALKDDFPILRDRLIFLFTFLMNPPRENAQEEDSIRNQIYALFCNDEYLLLPFHKMKDDFDDNKMRLSDCMIRIDLTIAKIRQLYFGFSDSWINLQVEKLEGNYFVSVHKVLSWIEKHAEWADSVIGQLQLYRAEFRFFRVFLLSFNTLDDTDEEIKERFNGMIASLQGIWSKKEGNRAHTLHTIRPGIADWHVWASELEGKIKQSKRQINACWENSFHHSLSYKPSTHYMILKCLGTIIDNLNDRVRYKADEIGPFKKQIETLEDTVLFLKNFLKLTVNCRNTTELGEFKMLVQTFAYDAACLTFFYWTKEANDKVASETNFMLSHMLQKIKPATLHVAKLYFGTLQAIYMQRSDSLMFEQVVFSFVDLFLENSMPPFEDDFQILKDHLVFLLSFLNDPPNKNAEVSVCSQIDVLFWEEVYGLLPFDGTDSDFSMKKMDLRDFIVKIKMVNASIKQKYYKPPNTFFYDFPKVISPRFLDFLIENLQNLKERMITDRKYAPFAKYKIIKLEEELAYLRPLFDHIFGLQSELIEIWLEVVKFLHVTECVISSLISHWFVYDHPIWYHMANLSDVFDGIKDVKTKLEMIKENNPTCFPCSASTLSEQAKPSEINEIVVGFEDEAKEIIVKLTTGNMSLDIISIVGMGGLGKTTLAKKVYHSLPMKDHFHVYAFCCVSQDHNRRKLLLDVLHDIKRDDDELSDKSDDELAHLVWKCLSRQRYLIVLDDIWNVNAWDNVKKSFPDDKNGSRILFTTRSYEVADKCKSRPHRLRFLSDLESWELLQKKVFHNSISPPHLYKIGSLIAKNCKGLPLAVSAIAGVLARTEKSLRWWSEVSERLVSYLSEEGCMKILELSYNHLPEYLKPCLLYLGAFPQDTLIRVKQVMLLWIAEGFVQESKTETLEDVAKGYFNDLVARSLVIVGGRSANGEIKTFLVHDLIHDLCQSKCRDGNFFLFNHGSESSRSVDPSINNHYRVATQYKSDFTIAAGASLSNPHSLLYFGDDKTDNDFHLRKFRLAQVLDLDISLRQYDIAQLGSLVHLRHIRACLTELRSLPSSIYNLWNIGSLTLNVKVFYVKIPETFWRMKSLRHVKVTTECLLEYSDVHEYETHHILDKLVSFSTPVLSSGKDLQRLLKRLPAVGKLSCILEPAYTGEVGEVETFNFDGKLESLKLTRRRDAFLINFPSTLKELTLVEFDPSWMAIPAIAELPCLEVLKLQRVSFTMEGLDIEDMIFQNLKFFELDAGGLVEWNASPESLPRIEQLVIRCPKLEGLPACFGESSTLKRIVLGIYCPQVIVSTALNISEEQMDMGIQVEVYNETYRLSASSKERVRLN